MVIGFFLAVLVGLPSALPVCVGGVAPPVLGVLPLLALLLLLLAGGTLFSCALLAFALRPRYRRALMRFVFQL